MSGFKYNNDYNGKVTPLLDVLKGATNFFPKTATTGYLQDGVEQNTFSDVLMVESDSQSIVGKAGYFGYKVNGTDIGLMFGPKNTRYSTVGTFTHTLHSNCTWFMAQVVGGGGGGGAGGCNTNTSSAGANTGNSGTGGNCVYVTYPGPASTETGSGGETVITFTIGAGGAGGAKVIPDNTIGTTGGAGGETNFVYNGTTRIRAYGGPGGKGGNFDGTGSNLANAASTVSSFKTGRMMLYSDFLGTYTGNPSNSHNAISAPDNSGFHNQGTVRFVNTHSVGYGNGGDGGAGRASGVNSIAGSAGTRGCLVIFEYFDPVTSENQALDRL